MATLHQISDRPAFAIMNGKTIPFEDAKVSIMAPGLTFAVTVFEGLRGYWQPDEEQLYVFRMEDHLKRQEFSMKIMELEDPPMATDTAGEIIEVLRANKMYKDCYIRTQAYVDDWGDITATGPVTSSVVCRPRARIEAFLTGKDFVVVSWRRNADDASPPRIKVSANYLNSRLAGLEAKRSGSSAIILNRDGTVSEGPGGCIFLFRDGRLITPTINDGILESITRNTLITLATDLGIKVEERRVGRTELNLATEGFYCGTGQEITPINTVDGKPLGAGKPGPITRELQAAYDGLVRGHNKKYHHWLTPVWPVKTGKN